MSIYKYEDGFYFSDECEQLNGPYDNEVVCKTALTWYSRYLYALHLESGWMIWSTTNSLMNTKICISNGKEIWYFYNLNPEEPISSLASKLKIKLAAGMYVHVKLEPYEYWSVRTIPFQEKT